MTSLNDLFDPEHLGRSIADGYVRTQIHPTHALTIANYTEKAAYENAWDQVTRQCRGLIYDPAGQVIARPLRKFFNYGQPGAPTVEMHEQVIVTDKQDGSMGILYPTPDGWAIATRGSFASEQAVHATEVFRTRYAGYEPPAGFSVIFEIIYPENRIVVDYGATDDLVLLGAVDIASGRSVGPAAAVLAGWPGPRTEVFDHGTLAQVLAAPPRDNAEGFVVYVPRTDERVKIKYEAYVSLHRIVTGLNARTVWQHLVDGKPLADLVTPLPDEFRPWVEGIADGITKTVTAEYERLRLAYLDLYEAMPDAWTPATRTGRGEFARQIAGHPDAWAMFALLDGKDIKAKLLANAKPEPYVTPSGRIFTEATA